MIAVLKTKKRKTKQNKKPTTVTTATTETHTLHMTPLKRERLLITLFCLSGSLRQFRCLLGADCLLIVSFNFYNFIHAAY